jgi:hypothetical protein
MKSKFILLVITFFVVSVSADDGCVADVSKYTEEGLKNRTAIFKKESPIVETLFPSVLQQYGFVDKAKLKNSIMVTYTTGGCAHYGYSFTFAGKKIDKVATSKKINRAERLLKDLELTKNEEKDLLLRALSEAKKKKTKELPKGIFELPCGDATCFLEDKGNQEVQINYSFPL